MDQETKWDSIIILAIIAAFVIIVVVAMALDARGDAGTLVQDDRGMVLDQPEPTVMLTDEEYQQFRQIVKMGGRLRSGGHRNRGRSRHGHYAGGPGLHPIPGPDALRVQPLVR